MPWLPDTNVWIEILKNRGGTVEEQLLNRSPAEIRLCAVVKAELWHGARKYGNVSSRLTKLQKLFEGFVSLPFDDIAAWHYGIIRHELEKVGRIIGPNDLKIAAICLANQLTLVTANTAEFRRLPELRLEDWSAPSAE